MTLYIKNSLEFFGYVDFFLASPGNMSKILKKVSFLNVILGFESVRVLHLTHFIPLNIAF